MSTAAAPDALFAAALRHTRSGDVEAARSAYGRLLERTPRHADALNNLALLEYARGDVGQAVQLLSAAVKIPPPNPLHLGNLSAVLADLGRQDEALSLLRIALQLAPRDAALHNKLGLTLTAMGQLEEAAAAYETAIACNARDAETYSNYGSLLSQTGRPERAIELLQKATALAPGLATAWNNLGNALMRLERDDEAITALRRAISVDGNLAETHTNLGIALMRSGRHAEGVAEYEWRWRTAAFAPARRPAVPPRWDGSPSAKRLLVHAEQGLGDTLQFCRYAPLLASSGHDVSLEVQPELVRLLDHSLRQRGIRTVPRDPQYPGFGDPEVDAHYPLVSLMAFFDARAGNDPYLAAEPEAAAAWRRKLAATALAGLRVGLVWAGNARTGIARLAEVDARRSLPLAAFAPLAGLDGVRLFSLQKGEPAAQVNGCGFEVVDLTAALDDFADTAALVDALDLVVTVDTSVAHLAGGMGKRVWMLSRFDGCWRWGRAGSVTDWYPSMRIFRQSAPGEWQPVIAEVAAALAETARPSKEA